MTERHPTSDAHLSKSQEGPAGERLQKVLAAAGLGSRRECEELIQQGRVEVAGCVVDQLGARVDPQTQSIRVDGVPIHAPRRVYYVVNKPVGVVTTNRDPSGRPRVVDLVETRERVFAVGRLDRSSEGLILVTNDGELSHRLTHPRFEVTKVYRAIVAGQPSAEVIQKLRKGVYLAEGVARVVAVHVRRRQLHSAELELTLREGRNREIRRILARVGHKVLQLRRIAFGPLRLGNLPPGAARRLTPAELRELQRAARQTDSTHAREPRSANQRRKSGSKKVRGAGAALQRRPSASDARQRSRSILAEGFEASPTPAPSRPTKKSTRRPRR